MNRKKFRTTILAGLMSIPLLLVSIDSYASKKTDKIFLRNGDRITGEIKELSQGLIRLKTDAIDTIYIKWEDIRHIDSDKWLQIELTDGTRFFGKTPETQDNPDAFSMQTTRGQVELEFKDVVRLEQINVDETFWQRLDNSLKVGFNYTKASDVANLNVNASSKYRTKEFQTSVSLDSTITRKSEGDDTKRADLTATYLRFKPNRWFWFASGSGQTNEELGIDLRAIASGGMGRYVMQTARTEWMVAAGLAANLEKTLSDDNFDSDDEASWEGLIQTEWVFFKLYSPKSRWRLRAQLYPGITDSDRNRGNLDLGFSQEFFKDLFWDMSFYFSYDSNPPETALAKEDYGVNTSIGYSF